MPFFPLFTLSPGPRADSVTGCMQQGRETKSTSFQLEDQGKGGLGHWRAWEKSHRAGGLRNGSHRLTCVDLTPNSIPVTSTLLGRPLRFQTGPWVALA